MVKYATFFAFSLLFIGAASAQTTGKTFTKPFNAEGATKIKLDLPGPVDLKIWNQANIRIEISVNLPSGSVSMLDQLSEVGRYNLSSVLVAGELQITSPNIYRVVRVKGEKLKENISYVVYVPKEMEVILLNSAALASVQDK